MLGRSALTSFHWKAVRARLTPFGGVHTSTGANPSARFPGQWFQSKSRLHQNWMRDDDPTTGRYLEVGPLGLLDGESKPSVRYFTDQIIRDPVARREISTFIGIAPATASAPPNP